MKRSLFGGRLVSLACAACLGSAPGSAAEVLGVAITRIGIYQQISADTIVPYSFDFQMFAGFEVPTSGVNVTVTKPNGSVTLTPDGANYVFEQEFATLSAMNSTWPNGTYTFRFSGAAAGNYFLALTAASSPGVALRVANFDEAQAIPAGQPFTLRWDPITGATANDDVAVFIASVDGSFIYESPAPGEFGALNGNATEHVLTLPPGCDFIGAVDCFKHVTETTLTNGVVGIISCATATMFTLHTQAQPPVFVSQPANVTVLEGGRAQFSAQADGPGVQLHWQRLPAGSANWVKLADTTDVTGSLGSLLSIAHTPRAWCGDQFRCVATGGGLSVTSKTALLTVTRGYLVTTVAGAPRQAGDRDGTGSEARFRALGGIACDAAGNAYVADGTTIRQITPEGVVTTFAGRSGESGYTDGPLAAARFSEVRDVALDRAGTIYVSDGLGRTLRRITPAGEVSTCAGSPGESGLVDGPGGAARFLEPGALAVNRAGEIFIADARRIIRRISPEGTVSTLAGAPESGYVDGVGSQARFGWIEGLATDRAGNVIVADADHGLRLVSPAGVVTTLPVEGLAPGGVHAVAVDDAGYMYLSAGWRVLQKRSPVGVVNALAGTPGIYWGHLDGVGEEAQGTFSALAVGCDGTVHIADREHHTVRTAAPWTSVQFTAHPADAAAAVTGVAVLSATASACHGESITYQWQHNGVDIPGATSATLTLPCIQAYQCGEYTLLATADGITAASEIAVVAVQAAETSPTARLLNLSTRGLTDTGESTMIAGFVISGADPQATLIRAVGPGLADFGVGGTLPDPTLTLMRQSDDGYAQYATNDDWGSNGNVAEIIRASERVQAFSLRPDSRDAALLLDLPPGVYTALIADPAGAAGVAIVELYDCSAATPGSRLVNLSTRGRVETGGNVMIPGFVISDDGPKNVLVRAIGPALQSLGVADALGDPELTIYRRIPGDPPRQEAILHCDNWGENGDGSVIAGTSAALQAFALPEGSKDAALVVTLQPGVYTAISSGVGDATGIALVEVYVVP